MCPPRKKASPKKLSFSDSGITKSAESERIREEVEKRFRENLRPEDLEESEYISEGKSPKQLQEEEERDKRNREAFHRRLGNLDAIEDRVYDLLTMYAKAHDVVKYAVTKRFKALVEEAKNEVYRNMENDVGSSEISFERLLSQMPKIIREDYEKPRVRKPEPLSSDSSDSDESVIFKPEALLQPKPLAMPEHEPSKPIFHIRGRSTYIPPAPAVHEESAPQTHVTDEMQPPIETQISPVISTPKPQASVESPPSIEAPSSSIEAPSPPIEVATARETKVKRLVKISSMSDFDKQKISLELINSIDNPYYKKGDRDLIAYKDLKMKFRAKDGNVFEDVKPRPRRVSSKKRSDEAPPPAKVSEVPAEVSEVSAQASRVRSLAQLSSIAAEDKAIIINELKHGIENPFYRLLGKGIGYKDAIMKKRAKKVNVFEDIQAPPAPQAAISSTEAPAEIPAPTADVCAAPSENEVAAVEQRVRSPLIKKRVLDLRREARSHDLIDKGFGGGSGDLPSDSSHGVPVGGHRKLDLSGLTGSLDLGEHRLSLKISGPF
jgi:hypothetical protein